MLETCLFMTLSDNLNYMRMNVSAKNIRQALKIQNQRITLIKAVEMDCRSIFGAIRRTG